MSTAHTYESRRLLKRRRRAEAALTFGGGDVRADLPALEHVWSLGGGGVAEIVAEATGESAELVDRRRRGSPRSAPWQRSSTRPGPRACP